MSIDGHVASVTLDRADKRNAIDLRMFAELGEAGDRIAAEPSVRAVVLSGAGEHFCAGIDVGIFEQGAGSLDAASLSPVEGSPANLFQRAAFVWRELRMPVICAIQGVAYGAGLQIALGADLRFAHPEAKLSVMEIAWGLVPDMAITATTRNAVHADRLKELAWTGRIVDGVEARALGLVTATHSEPLVAARALADEIARRSPHAIAAAKRLFDEGMHLPVAESFALEARLQMRLLGTPNQLEAARANAQGREPDFED